MQFSTFQARGPLVSKLVKNNERRKKNKGIK